MTSTLYRYSNQHHRPLSWKFFPSAYITTQSLSKVLIIAHADLMYNAASKHFSQLWYHLRCPAVTHSVMDSTIFYPFTNWVCGVKTVWSYPISSSQCHSQTLDWSLCLWPRIFLELRSTVTCCKRWQLILCVLAVNGGSTVPWKVSEKFFESQSTWPK